MISTKSNLSHKDKYVDFIEHRLTNWVFYGSLGVITKFIVIFSVLKNVF